MTIDEIVNRLTEKADPARVALLMEAWLDLDSTNAERMCAAATLLAGTMITAEPHREDIMQAFLVMVERARAHLLTTKWATIQ
jgi:hypothetical protein